MLTLILASRIEELVALSMFHDTPQLADGAHKIFASLGRRDQAVRKRHRLEQIVRLAKADPPTLSFLQMAPVYCCVSPSVVRRRFMGSNASRA